MISSLCKDIQIPPNELILVFVFKEERPELRVL